MTTRKASTTRKSASTKAHDTFQAAEKVYAEAMLSFTRKRDWAKAAEQFKGFIENYGRERELQDMSDRARVHLSTCQSRLAGPAAPPSGPADWMLLGVIETNRGAIDDALVAFGKALEAGADSGRVHYCRAAALSLADRTEEALRELKVAIDADPEARAHSMGDPDFERLRETAGYVALVEPPIDEDDFLTDDYDGDTDFEDGPPTLRPNFPQGPSIY